MFGAVTLLFLSLFFLRSIAGLKCTDNSRVHCIYRRLLRYYVITVLPVEESREINRAPCNRSLATPARAGPSVIINLFVRVYFGSANATTRLQRGLSYRRRGRLIHRVARPTFYKIMVSRRLYLDQTRPRRLGTNSFCQFLSTAGNERNETSRSSRYFAGEIDCLLRRRAYESRECKIQ